MITPGSYFTKLKIPISAMLRNQKERIGANEYPTLWVPNRWIEKRKTRTTTEIHMTEVSVKELAAILIPPTADNTAFMGAAT